MQRQKDFRGNKKGAITDLFVFIVIGFITVIVIGLLLFGVGEVNDTFMSLTDDPGGTNTSNFSYFAQETLDVAVGGLQTAKLVAFGILFGMALSILVTSFFVRSHPALLIVFIFVTVIAVIVAVPVSNVYEESILADSVIGETFQGFTAANFVLLNLPIWVTVLGLIGAALLAITIKTSQDLGSGI